MLPAWVLVNSTHKGARGLTRLGKERVGTVDSPLLPRKHGWFSTHNSMGRVCSPKVMYGSFFLPNLIFCSYLAYI